jgi:hypothetical protein
VTPNPKWTGMIVYKNKKGREVGHAILKGKKYVMDCEKI